ncbi:MAG: chromate efflux transporter [Pseudomonadota bacterium]
MDDFVEGRRADFADATRVFASIGVLSFGGPAAQIALMHRKLVDENGWLTERQFLNALGFCTLLPGPEAMQLATYGGWRLHGVLGGLMAGALFVLPGATVIAALAALYVTYGSVPAVAALFTGIQAAVLVVVIEALVKVSKRALQSADRWAVAALAFVALFFFDFPFPLVVLGAGLYGFFAQRDATQEVATVPHSKGDSKGGAFDSLKGALAGLVVWLLPLVVVEAITDTQLLAQVWWFFSKLAVVTFGGAYAVLAYMAQEVVADLGWLSAKQMMDGLGLAETTPGPLILVTEFVAFVAGYKQGGMGLAFAAAAMALWVTFVPCFIWIFAGAPHLDRLSAMPRLTGALSAITAAVVGVMLNLSLWFGLHVIFGEVSRTSFGPAQLWWPANPVPDFEVLALVFLAAVLLLGKRVNLVSVLTACALVSLLFALVG